MDKLERIFAMQQALNDDIQTRRHLNFTQEEWLQRRSLRRYPSWPRCWTRPILMVEKPSADRRAGAQRRARGRVALFISLCLRSGMDADELYRLYCEKNRENFDRQYGRSEKKGYESNRDGQTARSPARQVFPDFIWHDGFCGPWDCASYRQRRHGRSAGTAM